MALPGSDNFLPVSITPKAASEVKNIMSTKNIPAGYGLRIGVRGSGGCGGHTFIIGFDKKKDSDDSFLVEGIPMYIEKKQMMYLAGLEVDFVERETERGFTFVSKP
jgi:iron-sulfur cluster assembly protein